MKYLPETENALVLRTDFSNQSAWQAICAEIREPVDGFRANVDFVDDIAYRDITKEQLLGLFAENSGHTFVIVVDRVATSRPDHALLVVDLLEEPGREFRALPSRIQSIENNLSIGNMDFEEFAESADESGVFRGFPRP